MINVPIHNASSVPQGSGGHLPNMSRTLSDYLRPMIALKINRALPSQATGFLSVESESAPIRFNGVILPYPSRELVMKPEKQRAWKWVKLFSNTDLHMREDDKAKIDNREFRVMNDHDFYQAGYYQYELVEGYQ